jgi:hypothetical protein
MWKNVRAILAMVITVAYIGFTGLEVFQTKKVPEHFYAMATAVAGFYFITRAAEGREPAKSSTPSDQAGETEPIATVSEISVPIPKGETPIEG